MCQSLQLSENTQCKALCKAAPHSALNREVNIFSSGVRSLEETCSFFACVLRGLGRGVAKLFQHIQLCISLCFRSQSELSKHGQREESGGKGTVSLCMLYEGHHGECHSLLGLYIQL